MNTAFFEFLAARRSVKPDRLAAPAPTAEELNRILTVGTRVPDHKKLSPWRFIVFEWIAYSPTVREAFGLTEHEKFAGFIYIGTPMEKPEERERPKLEAIVKHWPA